jgi:hypothetical protein
MQKFMLHWLLIPQACAGANKTGMPVVRLYFLFILSRQKLGKTGRLIYTDQKY